MLIEPDDIEHEIKSFVEPQQIDGLLEGLTWRSSSEVTDVYYDTDDRSLFQVGVFVRVRNGANLDIKYNPDTEDVSHVRCLDKTFTLPLSEDDSNEIRAFLRSFLKFDLEHDLLTSSGLAPFVTISKRRANYVREGLTVSIDEVQGLGIFVEAEADSHRTLDVLTEYVRRNSLDNLPIGYVELYLRRHDFNLYSKGRYILPEDRPAEFIRHSEVQ